MPFQVIWGGFLLFGTIVGTKSFTGLEENDAHKPYKLPVLKDRKGDLSKEWFIEFYACTRGSDKPKRKRIKIPTRYTTAKDRRQFAKEWIFKISNLLAKGYLLGDDYSEEPEPVELPKEVIIPGESLLFESLDKQITTLKHLRKKSGGTYQSAINSARLFYPQDIKIKDFTEAEIYRLRDYFVSTLNNSAVTANKKIDHINRVFKDVRKRNGIKEDPFEEIVRLVERETSESNIAFTKEDQEILENCLRERDPELFRFTRYMYYAFIRPKELRNLRLQYLRLRELLITGNPSWKLSPDPYFFQ